MQRENNINKIHNCLLPFMPFVFQNFVLKPCLIFANKYFFRVVESILLFSLSGSLSFSPSFSFSLQNLSVLRGHANKVCPVFPRERKRLFLNHGLTLSDQWLVNFIDIDYSGAKI